MICVGWRYSRYWCCLCANVVLQRGENGLNVDDSSTRPPYSPPSEDLSSVSISSGNSPRGSFSGNMFGNPSKVTSLVGSRKLVHRTTTTNIMGGSNADSLHCSEIANRELGSASTSSTTLAALLPYGAGNSTSVSAGNTPSLGRSTSSQRKVEVHVHLWFIFDSHYCLFL